MNKPRVSRRSIDGIFLLDKISGVSSNDALQRVKRIFRADKAGHTGSLDPLASGLLPICLGEATKFSSFLLDADKRYTVTAKVGEQTDTADAEGALIATSEQRISAAQLHAILPEFVGKTRQIPPMYSALKKDGKALYELARKGIEVEREARDIELFSIDVMAVTDDTFTLDVHCSKGTYIRTLVEDIAAACGSLSHVVALRRTQAGPFNADKLMLSDDLLAMKERDGEVAIDALLLPINAALTDMPAVVFPVQSAHYLCMGNPVMQRGAPSRGLMQLIDESGKFFGIGEMDQEGRVAPKRLLKQNPV